MRHWLVGVVGNVLEHYDNALYGLLVPFLAPLFFPQTDYVTQLILGYAIMPLGLIARPAGSLFFGWIGDNFGRSQALSLSLTGMALVTMAMGFLPIYAEVGLFAPVLLVLLRMLQSFCMAGETVNGALFVLEKIPEQNRSLISSIYDASSVGGILLASLAVTLFAESWRYLFLAGSCTALFGLIVRTSIEEMPTKQKRASLRGKIPLLSKIAAVSGFTHITYAFAFTLMNGFLPLVSNLTKSDVLQINSYLLLVDMLLLPLFGTIAKRIGKERLMISAALVGAASAIPLFLLLDGASLATAVAVRMIFMTVGVAFSAPYHAWAVEQVAKEERSTILSLGYSLGSQIIGVPSAALSIYLFQQTGSILAPGLYFLVFALLASYQIGRRQALPQDC